MEAAIVLPIIVLVIITVVLIIMFFYSQIKDQSQMHIFLRARAAQLTEQTIYLNDVSWDGSVDTKKQVWGGYVYGKGYLIMSNQGVLDKKGTYVEEGTCHVVDSTKYVRYCTLIKGKFINEK